MVRFRLSNGIKDRARILVGTVKLNCIEFADRLVVLRIVELGWKIKLEPTTPYRKRPNLSGNSTMLRSRVLLNQIPFYGAPRPPKSVWELFLENAVTAMRDPTRADAVAAVGELTGELSLLELRKTMLNHETGKVILQERPIVSQSILGDYPKGTFGCAYNEFMKRHQFDPDSRDEVKYISDPELAYIMKRYRQNHDFFHTLTGLPPTVLGELGLKWLELFQTKLPLPAFSCTVGSLTTLNGSERDTLYRVYLPWARSCHETMTAKRQNLMNVYYEQELHSDLEELRDRIGVVVAPQV